jgi:hypothetical protein
MRPVPRERIPMPWWLELLDWIRIILQAAIGGAIVGSLVRWIW